MKGSTHCSGGFVHLPPRRGFLQLSAHFFCNYQSTVFSPSEDSVQRKCTPPIYLYGLVTMTGANRTAGFRSPRFTAKLHPLARCALPEPAARKLAPVLGGHALRMLVRPLALPLALRMITPVALHRAARPVPAGLHCACSAGPPPPATRPTGSLCACPLFTISAPPRLLPHPGGRHALRMLQRLGSEVWPSVVHTAHVHSDAYPTISTQCACSHISPAFSPSLPHRPNSYNTQRHNDFGQDDPLAHPWSLSQPLSRTQDARLRPPPPRGLGEQRGARTAASSPGDGVRAR